MSSLMDEYATYTKHPSLAAMEHAYTHTSASSTLRRFVADCLCTIIKTGSDFHKKAWPTIEVFRMTVKLPDLNHDLLKVMRGESGND